MANAVFRYCWFGCLCQSYISIALFDSDLDGSTTLPNINPAAFTWNAIYARCSQSQCLLDCWKVAECFSRWYDDTVDIVFGQHSAESAICSLGYYIYMCVCVCVCVCSRLHAYIPRWKHTIVTYSECVIVALVIQHATFMRRITLASVSCLALPYFPRCLINGTIHGDKNVIRHEMCVLIFPARIVWEISYTKKWAR